MAMSPNINDREMGKFRDAGFPDTVVAVNVESLASGLKVGGRITEVVIDNTTWTLLPATALADRNAVAIQNYSGQQIKLNYDNTVVGYIGVIVDDQSERFYDLADSILIYAKSLTSSCTIIVEELA